jgi:hypothetical protein
LFEEFVTVRLTAITVDFFGLNGPFGRGPTFRRLHTQLIVIRTLCDVSSATGADETTVGHHRLGHGIYFRVNPVYELVD